MKIAIVGSRGYKDIKFLEEKVKDLFLVQFRFYRPIFVSGGSSLKDKDGNETSADKLAENVIDWYNVQCFDNEDIKKIIFKPEWNKYGKSAGFRRNELIIKEADIVVAFWDGISKGTKHSIDLAIKAKKPVDIYVRS